MFFNTLLSIAKILIKSRWIKPVKALNGEPLFIVGNGPSALPFLAMAKTKKPPLPLFCVNKFAISPEFHSLKPHYYLLLDGDFFLFNEAVFQDPSKHPRVQLKPEFTVYQDQINRTWHAILEHTWGMTLFIPRTYKKSFVVALAIKQNIRIQFFNYTVTQGFNWFKNSVYAMGLGMPQSQNVIHATLFLAIQMGVKNIYITGIDHDFHRNLVLDDTNTLFEEVSHFYNKEPFRHKLIHAHGNGESVRLKEVFYNLHKVHVGYEELHRFAKNCKCQVFNITPGGFVDEFPRVSLDTIA